jgi:hypothetical protein
VCTVLIENIVLVAIKRNYAPHTVWPNSPIGLHSLILARAFLWRNTHAKIKLRRPGGRGCHAWFFGGQFQSITTYRVPRLGSHRVVIHIQLHRCPSKLRPRSFRVCLCKSKRSFYPMHEDVCIFWRAISAKWKPKCHPVRLMHQDLPIASMPFWILSPIWFPS